MAPNVKFFNLSPQKFSTHPKTKTIMAPTHLLLSNQSQIAEKS